MRMTYWNERKGHFDWRCENNEIADKLAAYEDIGLEPKAVKGLWESCIGAISAEIAEEQGCVEVNRAKEIACAEAEGRLVTLPCKIGDTVYEIDLPEYGVIVCNVLCFTYGRSNITRELTWSVTVNVIEGHGLGSCYTFDRDDFDKTVFFTREEAEAALMDGDRE